jgi:hypothetical protein
MFVGEQPRTRPFVPCVHVSMSALGFTLCASKVAFLVTFILNQWDEFRKWLIIRVNEQFIFLK